jgi:hypothetical protein
VDIKLETAQKTEHTDTEKVSAQGSDTNTTEHSAYSEKFVGHEESLVVESAAKATESL